MKNHKIIFTHQTFLIFSCFIEDGSSSFEMHFYMLIGLSLLRAIIGIVIWIINRLRQ